MAPVISAVIGSAFWAGLLATAGALAGMGLSDAILTRLEARESGAPTAPPRRRTKKRGRGCEQNAQVSLRRAPSLAARKFLRDPAGRRAGLMTRLNIHGLGFTLFLALLTALPPLAIDMALPSLPLIQADLHAPQTEAAAAIAIFIAGFSSAPIVVGPLADRFGRKAIMGVGLVLFTLSAAGAALAPSIRVLLAFRLVQGASAGAVGILPRAIIRDLFEGREARLQLAAVSLVFSVAPLIAPTLGAAILFFGSWRLIFAVLTGVSVLVTLVALVLFEESHAAREPPQSEALDGFRRIPAGADQSRMRGLFAARRPPVRGSLCLRQCFAAPVHAGVWRVEDRICGAVRHNRLRGDRRLVDQRLAAQPPCQP